MRCSRSPHALLPAHFLTFRRLTVPPPLLFAHQRRPSHPLCLARASYVILLGVIFGGAMTFNPDALMAQYKVPADGVLARPRPSAATPTLPYRAALSFWMSCVHALPPPYTRNPPSPSLLSASLRSFARALRSGTALLRSGTCPPA